MAAALEKCYADLRSEFVRRPTTAEYISPASRVVYDFVRRELNIPLNRGVEDHPPLLLRRAGGLNGTASKTYNGNPAAANGLECGLPETKEELATRGRTLGTMASEIYEALRRGELHDRVMQFGEGARLWASTDIDPLESGNLGRELTPTV
jgi:phenylalanine ammonia-lyase